MLKKSWLLTRLGMGTLAGAAATVPMTALLTALHKAMPPQEQYPLPPAEIVGEMAEESGLRQALTPAQEHALAVACHYGYGAAGGALYGALTPAGASSPLRGTAFGLAVWATSYLGWLPVLGILRPATEHPPRRTALMIAAHLVWGLALAALVKVSSHPSDA